ncbi:MAG: hypothetical protein A3I66_12810 [Burkholderiales bacterium RIFCSPLOWO2_02_FULL_57_36]|nr:MAG: hypothetical protein A3I66_12810 [Burkholderiales bacterium RIFCSPLOWO2_02_FULL_57_36]
MNTKIHTRLPWKWLLALLATMLLTACGGGGGGGDAGPVTSGGTTGGINSPGSPALLNVVSTSPADKATSVALNAPIHVTFNVKVEPATIISPASAFTIKEFLNGTNVAGTVAMDAAGTTAIFTPAASLAANTEYLGTVSTAVKNADGSTLTRDYTWTFTTEPPAVNFTYPASGGTAVAINTKIAAAFNTDIDSATVSATSFVVSAPGGAAVPGTVVYDEESRTALFAPSFNLTPSIIYTATVTTDVKDSRGNALTSNASWTFTTDTQSDTVKPVVSDFSPGHEVTGVQVNSPIKVTFSELMDPSTIDTGTFLISDDGGSHLSGRLVIDTANGVATFFPTNMLPNTRYHMVVTAGTKDLAGNVLDTGIAAEFVSFFETGSH